MLALPAVVGRGLECCGKLLRRIHSREGKSRRSSCSWPSSKGPWYGVGLLELQVSKLGMLLSRSESAVISTMPGNNGRGTCCCVQCPLKVTLTEGGGEFHLQVSAVGLSGLNALSVEGRRDDGKLPKSVLSTEFLREDAAEPAQVEALLSIEHLRSWSGSISIFSA